MNSDSVWTGGSLPRSRGSGWLLARCCAAALQETCLDVYHGQQFEFGRLRLDQCHTLDEALNCSFQPGDVGFGKRGLFPVCCRLATENGVVAIES